MSSRKCPVDNVQWTYSAGTQPNNKNQQLVLLTLFKALKLYLCRGLSIWAGATRCPLACRRAVWPILDSPTFLFWQNIARIPKLFSPFSFTINCFVYMLMYMYMYLHIFAWKNIVVIVFVCIHKLFACSICNIQCMYCSGKK